MNVAASLANHLPKRTLYSASAWYYRVRPEKELLFVDQLADPSRRAVDVGGWWGPWTYWLSRYCPEVITFEPNPVMAAHLRRVTADNVRVEAVALSDHSGEGTLWVPEGRGPDALASLREGVEGRGQSVTVPLHRLDDFEVDDVGFLKVDVEGHEYAVLEGALETIRRSRPVLLVELEENKSARPIDAAIDLLADLGYAGWIRRERQWASATTFDLEADQRAHAHEPLSPSYINNFVFLPAGSGAPDRRS